jgi:GT2 family glycosyltransferase
LSPSSSQFNKQNELIRSLRKQLEATEHEVASQKWLLQQYLQSPSWRLTAPLRWIVQQLRALSHFLTGQSLDSAVAREGEADSVSCVETAASALNEPGDESEALKQLFADLYRLQLQSLLTTGTTLQLPSSDAPEISVIVVTFNRAELSLACLRSLAEHQSERIEIIIVDNDSRDDTPLLLDRLRGARIIRNTENRHFLLAVNQAAKEARGDYLLLLNNDAQLLPGTLRSALRTMRSSPDIGAVGGRLILLEGMLQEAGSIIWKDGSCLGYGRGDSPFAPMYMFRRDVDYCSGAFLLTPRRLWNELGGFDERFQPAYYEETDYCCRVWERRLRVVYDPRAVVLHYEFGGSKSISDATDLQREHQRIFAARHGVMLSSHLEADANAILPARMKHGGKKRVLFIDDQVPHAWLGSGFPRARAILLTLLKHDRFITFYPLSQFDESWISVYSDMPPEIEFMMGYGPELLEPFLRNRQGYYDTIFVSRPHNMKLLKPLVDENPRWFDAVTIVYDAEAIFVTREITQRQLNGTPFPAEEARAVLKEEVDLASAADVIVAVSELDAAQFRQHSNIEVRVVGHSLAPAATPRAFQQRSGFLFVGAIHEEASPNADSVIWFLEEIFPKIQAQLGTEVTFTIAGVNKSARVRQLASAAVRFTGHLPDLTDLYDSARVFVAPTRYAAGIPHKVHEAAARGIPIVATPLLASQLGWKHGEAFLVGEGADDFAEKCIALYNAEPLWTKLRQAGLARIQEECSADHFEASVMDCLLEHQLNVGMDR